MRAECIQAVQRAVGRELTQVEIKGIEDRLSSAIRRAARRDPAAFMRMTAAQRLEEGAQLAKKEILEEAQLKKRRAALSIVATGRIADYLKEQSTRGIDRLDAMSRTLAPKLDGKDRIQSIDTRANAIRREALGLLSEHIEAFGPRMLGLLENNNGTRALVRALRGEEAAIPEAKQFAEQWKEITDALRERFNAAGGKVRYLEDWGFPQHHSQALIAKAGIEEWGHFVLPLLDRSRYFDASGRIMGDDEFRVVVESAWRSLATGGLSELDGAKVGSLMMANRHAAARQLHFKDADAWIAYQERFGEKSLMAVLVDHIDNLSRDLAAVEVLGPNPEATFRGLAVDALKREAVANPKKSNSLQRRAATLETLFNEVTGNRPAVGSVRVARGFDTLRNWLVASRLGSAVITSLSDQATIHLTAYINNLPEMQLITNQLVALNPKNQLDRRLAQRTGLALDTLIGSINRAGHENFVSGLSGRLATFAIRASGLNWMTEASRQAFGVTMMDAIGTLSRSTDSLAKLDADDHRILLSKGITETDWQVWRRAEVEDWGNGNGAMLTPEAIRRIPDERLRGVPGNPADLKREAVLKLLGVVLEETDVAVITPGARERVLMGSGLGRGTVKGELARSFFLFKSFPITMVTRHWRRALAMDAAGKAPYLAAMIAGTTVLGAVSVQINELLAGRDPRNINPAEKHGVKFWLQAMLKGGSLGLYGDFLYSQSTQNYRGAFASLAGPVAGLAEEAISLTQGNLVQAAQGKDTHIGAEAVRMGKGLTPGGNLWYAKAALDHMIFHELQEYFSPGYLRTMEARARREFGQSYWWQPGQSAPERAPAFEKSIGE